MSDDMLDQRTRHRLEDLQDIVKQDAKLIQNLRREIEKLRDALKPFAKSISGQFADILFGEMPDNSTVTVTLQLGYLRRARAAVTAERDALAARLAPVDDEALVEIVAVYCYPEMNWNEMSEKLKNSYRRDARAAIAAIRPHIEAVERERCAKIATGQYWSSALGSDGTAKAIAAAIRRGE